MFAALTLSGLFLAAAPPVAAPAAPAADAMAWIRRYDEMMAPASYEADISMTATREDGSTRSYTMSFQKSGDDKVRIGFSAPKSAVGQEVLRSGDNMWVYMPNLKRAVRLASRESFMGGDFNNGDVLRVHWQSDYTPTIVSRANGSVELDLQAKVKDATWDHIKLWMTDVDVAKAQPQKAEFYAASGKLLRTLEFKDVKDFGKVSRPSTLIMGNVLVPARKSEMRWEKLDVKPVSDKRFGLDDLGR